MNAAVGWFCAVAPAAAPRTSPRGVALRDSVDRPSTPKSGAVIQRPAPQALASPSDEACTSMASWRVNAGSRAWPILTAATF
jgi:hypothetical protein